MALLRRSPQPETGVPAQAELVPALLGALVVDDDPDDLIGPFADAKARADDLLAAWLHGDADKWTTGTAFAEVRVVAANGTEWTVGATSGLWFSRPSSDSEWVPAMVPSADEIARIEAGGPLRCAWVAGELDQPETEPGTSPAPVAPVAVEQSVGDVPADAAPVPHFDVYADDSSTVDEDDAFFDTAAPVDLDDVISAAGNSSGDTQFAVPVLDAGWYEDPDDPSLIRWWDGQGWTSNTLDNPNI